ncbi:MAG: peptidylprolyl isomerase [Atopobiaceae bacterium]|nr:peptidylprolyl isomerase [Atopobiaceae bacterium]
MQDLDRRSFVRLSAASLLCAGALAACGGTQQAEPAKQDQSSSSGDATKKPGYITSSGTLITPYDEGYDTGLHHATIVVKDLGTIKVELDADTAPISVSNFAHLVNEGFYNGLTFHRIMDGFMIQGGDPTGSGKGGNTVRIMGEFSENGIANDISHERGVISMARSSNNNSASSQFFIMHADKPSIDGKYAAFGHVTEGIEVVDEIAKIPVEDDNGTVDPANQPVIESITMDD